MSVKDTNPKDAIGARKVALSLLSPIAKAAWSVAQFSGLVKYGAWNWRKAGVRISVYLDAIDRHRDAILSGEWYDPVDGTPHLGNIMACCAIILDAAACGKLIDDRPPSVDMRAAYAETEAIMATLREKYKDMSPRHYTIADTEPTKFAVLEPGTPVLSQAGNVIGHIAADGEDTAIDLAAPSLSEDYCGECDHDWCICSTKSGAV
jgi:hypothetical protein